MNFTSEQLFLCASFTGIVAMVGCFLRAIYGLLQRRDRLYSLKYGEYLEQKTRVEEALKKARENG